MRATVHEGPSGGVEYRLWTGADTFRVVSKYQASAHLTPEEKAKAESMEDARREKKRKEAEDRATWRGIMSPRRRG